MINFTPQQLHDWSKHYTEGEQKSPVAIAVLKMFEDMEKVGVAIGLGAVYVTNEASDAVRTLWEEAKLLIQPYTEIK